jgi:hypothetical protein
MQGISFYPYKLSKNEKTFSHFAFGENTNSGDQAIGA